MRTLFADTFYFIAWFNGDDPGHRKAVGFKLDSVKLVTTAWVLAEVGDASSAPENRSLFLNLLEMLQSSPDVRIVSSSDDWFERGVELYRQRLDKEWSLTDCISFSVMSETNLTEALTADRHFEQAGFRALLK